jgi:hypothetical protein
MYIIYKIVCNDLNIKNTYVGSTTNFTKRKYNHKQMSKKITNRKLYQNICENGGWENWTMLQLETIDCSKPEALLKEREWYEKLNAELNMLIPSRTNQEYKQKYYENNKDKSNQQSKLYRENNKEHIAEYRKIMITCECGCEILKCNLSRHLKSANHIKLL